MRTMLDEKKWQWFWTADWTTEDVKKARLVYFRQEVSLREVPPSLHLCLFADSRYKLYINGELVGDGPQKGYGPVRFYDTVPISPFLHEGVNVFALVVLRYPQEAGRGNHSLLRLPDPVVALRFEEQELLSPELWQSMTLRSCEILPEETRFSPLVIHEHFTGDQRLLFWQRPGYDAQGWGNVRQLGEHEREALLEGIQLQERCIPLMRRAERIFTGVTQVIQGAHSIGEWERFLGADTPLQIPPHSTEVVEIDAGEEMTGFLKLSLWGGKGAQIHLLQAEAYVQQPIWINETDCIWSKEDRTDFQNGHLEGYEDVYQPTGLGTEDQREIYEPFWFRTFRFLRITIKTGDSPLSLGSLLFQETGYPLEANTTVTTSDPSHAGIWDLSLRTLRRCMHDTYIDCPFYEQLQYIMDSRTEMLYTYAVSADDRLARACMEAFRYSQREDGMMNCSYPNGTENLIVGFPVYYVLMLHDHMMYFGDKDFIRRHLDTADRVLGFYDSHLDERGMLGKVGDVNLKSRYWSFIDWADPWNDTSGMPPAGLTGPITMESLLYLLALQAASDLAAYVGEEEQSATYKQRAGRVQEAVRKYCIPEDGMVQDGSGISQYSQHGQVFAILTHTIPKEQGRKNLLRTLQEPEKYAQCTVAMRYYLFRALEMTDLYDWTDKYWETWRQMLRGHCTTSVEGESYSRSECHAWGSLILYELPATVLGVRPAAPGFREVQIQPVPGYLTEATGTVKTPKGNVQVSWKREGEDMKLSYTCPENMVVKTQ